MKTMRWSFNIGKLFGITLRIHVTFLLLLFFVYISVLSEQGQANALRAVLFISAIFVCVLIHELGHSLIAGQFGRGATSITLLPIGGIASMEEIPEKPGQEIAIAIIGPFINLAIAGIIYLYVRRWDGLMVPTLAPSTLNSFLSELMGVNVLLAIFNLIPAFPMDGGRVLRSLLALKWSYTQATAWAASVGQSLAAFFIFYGIFFNWWLAIIGLFLYLGADSEKRQTIMRSVLHQMPARAAMTTAFHCIEPDERLSQILEYVYRGSQDDFPVVVDNQVQGILTRTNILSAIHVKGVDIPAGLVMDREFARVDTETPLDEAYQELVSKKKTAAVVLQNTQLLGMLSLESIGRFFMIQAALRDVEIKKSNSLLRPVLKT